MSQIKDSKSNVWTRSKLNRIHTTSRHSICLLCTLYTLKIAFASPVEENETFPCNDYKKHDKQKNKRWERFLTFKRFKKIAHLSCFRILWLTEKNCVYRFTCPYITNLVTFLYYHMEHMLLLQMSTCVSKTIIMSTITDIPLNLTLKQLLNSWSARSFPVPYGMSSSFLGNMSSLAWFKAMAHVNIPLAMFLYKLSVRCSGGIFPWNCWLNSFNISSVAYKRLTHRFSKEDQLLCAYK